MSRPASYITNGIDWRNITIAKAREACLQMMRDHYGRIEDELRKRLEEGAEFENLRV